MAYLVRTNVFETNSSSTHSIALATIDDFQKFLNGELLYSIYNDVLVSPDEILEEYRDEYLTFEEFKDWTYDMGYATFTEERMLKDGSRIGIIGYYGYNG